jgi:hypothetical protein
MNIVQYMAATLANGDSETGGRTAFSAGLMLFARTER